MRRGQGKGASYSGKLERSHLPISCASRASLRSRAASINAFVFIVPPSRTPSGESGRRAPGQRRPPLRSGRPQRTRTAPGTAAPAPASPRRWPRRAARPTRPPADPSTTPALIGAGAPGRRSADRRARSRGAGPPPVSRTAPRASSPGRTVAAAVQASAARAGRALVRMVRVFISSSPR